MSEKKLYHVVVNMEFTMAVAAESASEAESYANSNYNEELENIRPDVHSTANTMLQPDVGNYDYEGTLPHNSDDDRTVDQWFEASAGE